METPVPEPRDVRLMRIRLGGADFSAADLDGGAQHFADGILELRDPQDLKPSPADPDISRYLAAEAFIESDAPEIVAEAEKAVHGVSGTRARAERLTRYVNALLDKKPTVSLPSAREVLRTKVGDCNEHTALYVAMARALGIPARIAVGLVYIHGAFYYHAWPEVYIEDPGASGSELGARRGLWLPVDPTLNEFPANATHLRLARGGLDKQAGILPLIGQIKITITDVELAPNSSPVLIGRGSTPSAPFMSPVPVRAGLTCWSSPSSFR